MAAVAPAQDDLSMWRRRRPQVGRIDIAGNESVSSGTIRRAMQISTAGFWAKLGLRERPRLLVGAETRDEAAVRFAYRRHGFWDAQAAISAVPDPHSEKAVVTVFVEEGQLYRWGDVSLSGDHEDIQQRAARVLRQLGRGQPADSLELALAVTRVQTIAANYGHPRSRLRLTVAPRGDSLDVVMDLNAGREVRLGELEVEGATRTRESYIRKEVNWRPGALYSQQRLNWRKQDVYNTGLFSFVRLEPAGPDSLQAPDTNAVAPVTADTSDFRLRVVERKPSFIGFRTGAGQDPQRDLTWDYAFEWGSRNWFGTGRKWLLTAQSGFVVITDWRVIHHRFAASYTEPWIFNVRLPTTLTLAFEPGVKSAVQDYSVERISGELNVTRRIKRISRIWSSLVYERVNIYGIPEEREDQFIEEEGISLKRRWIFAYERDSRPSVFLPTAGSRSRIDLEYVGGILGGANDFYKVDVSWARYQRVSPTSILATRFRLAWAKTLAGGTFVPTIDRYYLGGANSIRGYSENSIGPVDSTGAPNGGLVVVLANMELRTPVIWKFWFTFFGDAGNNWGRFRDVRLDEFLVSVGLGWQYMAPVGPIRLDYARRVVHPTYPASDRLHLSILFAF